MGSVSGFYDCLFDRATDAEELRSFIADPATYLANPLRPCGPDLDDDDRSLILSEDEAAIRARIAAETGTDESDLTPRKIVTKAK